MKSSLLYFFFAISSTFAFPPSGYRLVFNQEFYHIAYDASNILSPGKGWGSITSPHAWIEHTPYAGDFGSAYFTGPAEPNGDGPGRMPPNPFSGKWSHLRISAYWDSTINHWRSGLISSADQQGNGFSQALGYWEAMMQLPAGQGVWPAFWLAGINGIPKGRTTNSAEVDVVEMYGVDMTKLHSHVHDWTPAGKDVAVSGSSIATVAGVITGWHKYACLVNADFIYFYFDDIEIFQAPTPQSAMSPLYCMADLALGGGWPISCPSPTILHIQYIRCYAPP